MIEVLAWVLLRQWDSSLVIRDVVRGRRWWQLTQSVGVDGRAINEPFLMLRVMSRLTIADCWIAS